MRGLLGNLVEAVQENPSIAAGICTFAVAFSLVAGNALYGQSGGHPVPLFATRDAMTTHSLPKSGSKETKKLANKTSRNKVTQIPVPEARPSQQVQQAQDRDAVRHAQQSLLELGMYDGEVDGKFGPRTRQAVLRFEQQSGAPATGEISTALLQKMDAGVASSTKTSAAQKPKLPPEVSQPIVDDTFAPTNSVSVDAEEVRAILSGTAPESPSQASVESEIRDAAVLARIQIGLINFGEAEVTVDGILNDVTASAIRRFQTRYGLEVDGAPGEALMLKMEQIGALKKS